MEYKLSLGEWNSVFAIPCGVVDKHILSSNEVQLKVLLWILRNSARNIDSNRACNDLKISNEEFKECFLYWQNLGILSLDKDNDIQNNNYENTYEENYINDITKEKRFFTKYQRPESSHIISRIKESKNISYLIHEAQLILGRPMSSVDSTVLIMLHDNEGLPIDVILMLLQYAVSVGKSHIRYIEKIGMSWARLGIDNIEKAEEKINSMNYFHDLWKRFRKLIGIEHRAATTSEEEIITKWYRNWKLNDDIVKYAYEICVSKQGRYVLKYMDGILKQWYNQGISSMEQIKENSILAKNKNLKSAKFNTSYNIEEYEDYLKNWYNKGMLNETK